jgi:wobble nucleotide-excising tRNase
MLTRIERIRNIGVYYDFGSKDSELDLRKNNVVYANNGYGKSTLTAILRSYKENDSEYIVERSSIGEDSDQKVLFRIPSATIIYEDGSWSIHPEQAQKPKIAIFDEKFVLDNLFVREIERGHQKKIYQLVFGDEAQDYQDRLSEALECEKDLRGQKNAGDKELEKRRQACDCHGYLQMSDDLIEDAQSRLKEVEKQIRIIKQRDEINSLLSFDADDFTELIINTEWLDNLNSVLNKSIENMQQDTEELINNHFFRYGKDSQIEGFIRTGMALKEEDMCPFCGQDLANAQALIRAYHEYFGDVYQTLIEEIDQCKKDLDEWDYQNFIRKVERWIDSCEIQKNKIQSLIGESYEIEKFDLSVELNNVDELLQTIKQIFKQKSQSPLKEIHCPAINELRSQIDEINQIIREYHQNVLRFYENLREQLNGTNAETGLETLQNEKKKYQSRINRRSQEEEEWCRNYIELKDQHEDAEQALATAKNEMDAYASDVFSTFQEKINEFLDQLRAPFSIGEMEYVTDGVSKEPFANFAFLIRDEPVCLKSKSRTPQPQFSNTLSNGDRNTLSLAFFLSWLDMQPDLDEYIVVFDDPLTSMDENRLLGTSKALCELSENVKQLIVLTHKKDFMFHLDNLIPNLHGISLKCDTANGSRLVPYDIRYGRKDEHQKLVDGLMRYVDEDYGRSVNQIQEDIRKVIEKVLRVKYYPQFQAINTLGSMIDHLSENEFLSEEIIKDLRDLNKISSPPHHAEESGQPLTHLRRQDIIPEVERTLEIIRKI